MNRTLTEDPKAILRTIVNQAIADIRDEAATFTRVDKVNYDPEKYDIVTSADKRAQERYVGALRAAFPGIGIIGEEDGLCVPCLDLADPTYFTVDPLDGTKAFARYQSYGVGTMLALVGRDAVKAAFLGDVNTGEIYGYYGDEAVTRTRFGVEAPLAVKDKALTTLNVLFDDPLYKFPEAVQALARNPKDGGIFRGYEVAGGSVGLLHARLWIGEVGALVLKASFNTPWDNTPTIGVNRKLGFKHVKFDPTTGAAAVFEPELPTVVAKKGYIEVITHESHVAEVLKGLVG